MIKEACVEGFVRALRAQELGADRIELCENLAEGGTTPSIGTVMACKKYLDIPVIIMIRCRGGNFVYHEAEMEIMAEDTRRCLAAGADGIATGMLTPTGEVNLNQLNLLVRQAGTMQITFHKAIDEARDIEKEFLRLRDSGLVHRVLTSGGAPSAIEGKDMLNRLISLSGSKIKILVAGKVTHLNLPEIARLVDTDEFHGKTIVGELT